MNVLATIVGVVVVVVTVSDVVLTMVLPRRPSGVERLSLWVNRSVRICFVLVSHLARTYERQDAVLAPAGPVALVVQLLFWAACLVLGFGLILVGTGASFADGLLQAMTALFTVGSVHSGGPADTGVDISIGAIWVVIVALQIAYLPALYSSFNRREGLVALLESRAGVPAWGPELLARHQLVGITDTLPDLYAAWEQWSADVAETHTTYPGAAPLPVARTVVLVAPRSHRSSRCRRYAPGARTERGVFPGPSLPKDGIHIAQSDCDHDRMGSGPRSESRWSDRLDVCRVRESGTHARQCGVRHRAKRRGGVGGLPRLEGQLRECGVPIG